MARHFESFACLETFDPNMIGARERLIWLQRLRSGHDVWDDERHFGTLEIAPEDRCNVPFPASEFEGAMARLISRINLRGPGQ